MGYLTFSLSFVFMLLNVFLVFCLLSLSYNFVDASSDLFDVGSIKLADYKELGVMQVPLSMTPPLPLNKELPQYSISDTEKLSILLNYLKNRPEELSVSEFKEAFVVENDPVTTFKNIYRVVREYNDAIKHVPFHFASPVEVQVDEKDDWKASFSTAIRGAGLRNIVPLILERPIRYARKIPTSIAISPSASVKILYQLISNLDGNSTLVPKTGRVRYSKSVFVYIRQDYLQYWNEQKKTETEGEAKVSCNPLEVSVLATKELVYEAMQILLDPDVKKALEFLPETLPKDVLMLSQHKTISSFVLSLVKSKSPEPLKSIEKADLDAIARCDCLTGADFWSTWVLLALIIRQSQSPDCKLVESKLLRVNFSNNSNGIQERISSYIKDECKACLAPQMLFLFGTPQTSAQPVVEIVKSGFGRLTYKLRRYAHVDNRQHTVFIYIQSSQTYEAFMQLKPLPKELLEAKQK